MKKISIFGGYSDVSHEDSEDISKLGEFLSLKNKKTIFLIGGFVGYLKSFVSKIPNKKERVCVVGTIQGKRFGFHSNGTEELKFLFTDGYFGKKKKLFDQTVNGFIVLPGSDKSLGVLAELVESIDHINSFDAFVNQVPRPVILYGEYWRQFINDIIYTRISDLTKKHIHFVKKGCYDDIVKILNL